MKNNNSLPGYNAEVSLYEVSRNYGRVNNLEISEMYGAVYPQISISPQRATFPPYGPIGLPGEDCIGACLHVCHTFPPYGQPIPYGWINGCLNDCINGCIRSGADRLTTNYLSNTRNNYLSNTKNK